MPLTITCVLVSHEKPATCLEAVESVRGQSHPDWRLVVIDSGRLLADGHFAALAEDKRITVVPSGETPEMRRTHCLQGWCCNEVFRRGLIPVDSLATYLCDDDVYDPDAFAAFVAAAANPAQSAWYGSLEVWEGQECVGVIKAEAVGGAGAESLDLRADGLQVCHRAALWARGVRWPERRCDAWHADGVFLARLGQLTPICPLPATIGKHRRTAASRYTRPGSGGLWVEIGGGDRPLGAPWLNVDRCDSADVVLDLEREPLPFPDGWVGRLYSSHCLEHVVNLRGVLREIVRVCRVGAEVELRVPHWLSPMALCHGHIQVIPPEQIEHWCATAIPYWWAGSKKRFKHIRTEQIPSGGMDSARRLFPHMTDEERMTWVPGVAHEVRYHFIVVPNES